MSISNAFNKLFNCRPLTRPFVNTGLPKPLIKLPDPHPPRHAAKPTLTWPSLALPLAGFPHLEDVATPETALDEVTFTTELRQAPHIHGHLDEIPLDAYDHEPKLHHDDDDNF